MMISKDQLSELFANLLAEARYERGVRALLQAPTGSWMPLKDLFAGHETPLAVLRKLVVSSGADPHVTWLAETNVEDTGFVLILGYCERVDWIELGRYNRDYLAKRSQPDTSGIRLVQ